jgi:hypothetical protein
MSSPVCGARGLVVAGWHKPAKGYSARRTASFLQRTLDEAVVRGELTPCDTNAPRPSGAGDRGRLAHAMGLDRDGNLRNRFREDLDTLLQPRYPPPPPRRERQRGTAPRMR